jgi:acyl-CoA hydrolase
MIIALQSTNRERTGSRIVAKLVGGQMDFVRAANRAAEGRSLADGVVTTPRAEADLVVTEHGIAELRGRTLCRTLSAGRTITRIAVAFEAGRDGLA